MRTTVLLFFMLASVRFGSAQGVIDLKVLDAGPFNYVTTGTYPVYITVKNQNINHPVNTLQAYWQIDNGVIHSSSVNEFLIYPNTIYPTFEERLTHNDSMMFITTGVYELKVWTSSPNNGTDPNPSNDTAKLTVHVVDSLPEKKVVVFYGTHTECFPCGTYGEPQVEAIMDSFPENVYLVSVHDGPNDPYMNPEGIHLNDVYIWPYTGHPAFVYDLFTYPYFTNVIPDNSYVYWSQYKAVPLRQDYRYPVEVTLEKLIVDSLSHTVSGEVHAKFYADYSGDLAINALIVEDSIYGWQDGMNTNIYHRYILQDMTDGVYGDSLVIPSAVSAGDEYVYTFSATVPSITNPQNIYVTGYVQHASADSMKCDILNSAQKRVTEFATATLLSPASEQTMALQLFPNPVNDIITIKIPAFDGEGVIYMYDEAGRELQSSSVYFKNGITEFNVSGSLHGLYIMKVVHSDQCLTARYLKGE